MRVSSLSEAMVDQDGQNYSASICHYTADITAFYSNSLFFSDECRRFEPVRVLFRQKSLSSAFAIILTFTQNNNAIIYQFNLVLCLQLNKKES